MTNLVVRYIKSAANSLKYTNRVRNVVTMSFCIWWGICVFLCIKSAQVGFDGLYKIKIAKGLLTDVPILEKNWDISYKKSSEMTRQLYPINVQFYQELGIENPDPTNSAMPQLAVNIQKDKIMVFWMIPIYLIAFLLGPWVLLKTIYWVKDANNTIKL